MIYPSSKRPSMLSDLIRFRQELHQHPEKSGQEKNTAKRIAQQLKTCQPTKLIEQVGGHGVIAIFDSKKDGKTLLFRADIDALPIQEENDFPYKSIHEGVSHKCGHDGHSTILIGLAQKLQQNPLKRGKVILLFQPAEEIGQGAKAVLADEKFATLKLDYAFALHNVPSFPKGQIIYRKGAFNPAVISLIIKLKGKKAHAAEQENGLNPDSAIAQLITEIKQWHNNDFANEHFANITTIFAQIGSKDYGTSAGYGELHYTIRCWTKDKLAALKTKISKRVEQVCQENSLIFELEWLHYFAATANDDFAVDQIKKSAKKLGFDTYEKPFPFKWGEDFGLFTEHIPGAMFGLGAGENTPALHHPDYDFPDDIIPYGIELFYGIIEQF